MPSHLPPASMASSMVSTAWLALSTVVKSISFKKKLPASHIIPFHIQGLGFGVPYLEGYFAFLFRGVHISGGCRFPGILVNKGIPSKSVVWLIRSISSSSCSRPTRYFPWPRAIRSRWRTARPASSSAGAWSVSVRAPSLYWSCLRRHFTLRMAWSSPLIWLRISSEMANPAASSRPG